MTCTKEFEEWAFKTCCDEIAIDPEAPGSFQTNHDPDDAHFWLSAFARLVREEAATKNVERMDTRLALAFNSICERFGLEEK